MIVPGCIEDIVLLKGVDVKVTLLLTLGSKHCIMALIKQISLAGTKIPEYKGGQRLSFLGTK